jgi:hypothetical protein
LPIRYDIDHRNRFVTVQAEGAVVLDDILAYFDALAAQGAMPYPKLIDARRAEPQLSADDMAVLGSRVSAYAAYDPRGPIAAVAGTARSQDFMQRFKTLNGARRAFEIFATVEGAQAWLATLSAGTTGPRPSG